MRTLFIAIFSLLSIQFALNTRADVRGDMTLGLSGGYTSVNESGYAKVYFRYAFASHVRIAPETGYVFKHNGQSGFNFDIDMQFPSSAARGIQLYPLAGVAFNSWNYEDHHHDSRFGLNAGAGIDLKFTRSLRLTIQAKYTLMRHTDGLYVGAGIGYNF